MASGGSQARARGEQVLLDLEADGPLRRDDAPSHRQCPLADAQCQHQHLVALVDLGLIQDQNQRLALLGHQSHAFRRKGCDDVVRLDQRVHHNRPDPLKAHVDALDGPGQSGGQIHQVGAAHVEHGGDQQGEIDALGLALGREETLEFSADAVGQDEKTGHRTRPWQPQDDPANHARGRTSTPTLKTDGW